MPNKQEVYPNIIYKEINFHKNNREIDFFMDYQPFTGYSNPEKKFRW